MTYKEIQDLIKLVNKNNISELKIEDDNFKIVIRSQSDQPVVLQQALPQSTIAMPMAAAPAPASVPAPAPAPLPETQTVSTPADDSNLVEIKSPMIGTFYRSPGPDKDPFVSIGDSVNSGDVICMIEAMKLFNEIEAEQKGKIVKILVEDATPVEFDQPLFLIDPTA